jgi:hypothetical protein
LDVGNFLVFREQTQVLNRPLDEKEFVDDLFVFHAWVFEILDVGAFLFHLGKNVSQFLFIGDELLFLGDLHDCYSKILKFIIFQFKDSYFFKNNNEMHEGKDKHFCWFCSFLIIKL